MRGACGVVVVVVVFMKEELDLADGIIHSLERLNKRLDQAKGETNCLKPFNETDTLTGIEMKLMMR